MDYSNLNSLPNLSESLNSVNSNNAVQHRKSKHQGRYPISSGNGPAPSGRLVPVILSSDKLVFSKEDSEKMLTLYNPFNFDIDYKLYTTAPRRYTVSNAEGSVQAQYCVDIQIKRRFIEESVTGFADKFQIKIFSNLACIGKKDVLVFLNTTEDISLFSEMSTVGSTKSTLTKPTAKSRKSSVTRRKIPWIPIALSTVSLAVLVMPFLQSTYNILDYNHKLIAAFLIGVIIGRYWK